VRSPLALDVSHLPTSAFGARTPVWWAVWGLIVIESTMFALLIASYLYLRLDADMWPPAGTPPPRLTAATVNVGVLLVSLLPMVWVQRAAYRHARLFVFAGLSASVLLGLVAIAVRLLEFRALGCRWDSHAYGSLTWAILGMHLGHLVASVVETALLALLFMNRPIEAKHYGDAEVNALYWYFVVGAWLPLYVLVFFGPRMF
jgi:cytochrome c oxidase subunit III